jgi:hypothetical protein
MGIVAMACRRGNFDDSFVTDARSYFGKDELAEQVLWTSGTSA